MEGTIVFASVGRAHYAFDVFALDRHAMHETQLTDGSSINFNAQFVAPHDLELARAWFHGEDEDQQQQKQQQQQQQQLHGLIHVSERLQGKSSIFLDLLQVDELGEMRPASRLLGPLPQQGFVYCDRPSIVAGRIIFTSTNRGEASPASYRQPWTGVYAVKSPGQPPQRLTPLGVADYSPVVSPSGRWVAVASNLGRPWGSDIHELQTAICIFSIEDGNRRRVVAPQGGWPTWADDSTLYFHRRAPEDDWWSIYRVKLESMESNLSDEEANVERVTPPGVHVFTPAASTTGNWIAVATRRQGSAFRHVEIYDLETKSFTPLTNELHPELHHFNPFVSRSHDGNVIGYHRSRKPEKPDEEVPLLQHVASPPLGRNVTMVRLDGAFPSLSPDGTMIAFNSDFEADDSGVFVANLDGSGRRRIFRGLAFSTAWDWKQPGVVYTSVGHIFTNERSAVHVVKLTFDLKKFHSSGDGAADSESLVSSTRVQVLTKEGTSNNAFPSPSPDGKTLVFRSGRSGHKNLFIMDAELGEEGGIRQITEGSWVDTMPNWSPDGQWIAFSSTRHDPASGTNFALYLVRPDGSQLHKVLPNGDQPLSGRFNHVCFSQDMKKLLFTADTAGVSAEPVSVPNQFQPYGELFMCNLDGSDLVRLTENAYEDGTPCWGPIQVHPDAISKEGVKLESKFQDCLWLDAITEKMKHYSA